MRFVLCAGDKGGVNAAGEGPSPLGRSRLVKCVVFSSVDSWTETSSFVGSGLLRLLLRLFDFREGLR